MAAELPGRVGLARLDAELGFDLEAMQGRAEEARTLLCTWETVGQLTRPELVLLAVDLHGYYTAFEVACERIASQLDREVPEGPTWHSDLLVQMQLEIPGLRSPVIAAELLPEVHELRRFRHFFRHAYVVDFDPQQVRARARALVEMHDRLAQCFEAFRAWLRSAIDPPPTAAS